MSALKANCQNLTQPQLHVRLKNV